MRAAATWAGADIRRRRGSVLVLAVIVAVAVGPALALIAGGRRADRAFDRFLAATETPEILLSSGAGPTPELLASLEADRRIARVERAEGVFLAPAPMEPGADGFAVIGVDGSLTGGFGRPPVVAGRYPVASATDEIVVNERAAVTHGLRVGQRVPLSALPCLEGCPSEPVGAATVVGIVRLPTDIVGDPSVTGVVIAAPALLDGRWRDYARLPTWLGIHLYDAADTSSVIADLSVQVVDGEVAGSREATATFEASGRRQHNALLIAAAVVALAGALVAVQAQSRHLAVRWADPSVLAAMGMTPRERTAAGVLSASPAIVAGLAGAIGVAVALSPVFPLGLTRRADPDIGFHADAVVLLLGVALALVALTGVAAIAARRWAMPARVAETTQTPSIAARASAALGMSPVASTGSQFALEPGRGINRLPVIPTLVAVTGVTAVVVGALVVRWSVEGLVEAPDRYGQAWELQIEFSADDLSEEASRLAADPRVRDVAVSRTGEVNLTSEDRTVVQVPTTGIESLTGAQPLTVLDGRAPAGPREIALSVTVMRRLGLGIGDTTTASGSCGTFEVDVVGRVIVPITSGNYPDDGSLVTRDAFDELCAQDLMAEADMGNTALVKLRDPDTAGAVRDEWQARGLLVTDRPVPASINSLVDIRPVPGVVALIAGLLGTVAAAHALLLAVRRRRGDVAVLRALGLRPRQAGGIIRWQSAVQTLVAIVVGLPLGLMLGRLVWTAIAEPSNVLVRVDITVLGLTAVAAAALAIAVLVSIWPSRRAARLRPAAVLRSE
jgi:ABC-type lipoprotein release transport system permease subunit